MERSRYNVAMTFEDMLAMRSAAWAQQDRAERGKVEHPTVAEEFEAERQRGYQLEMLAQSWIERVLADERNELVISHEEKEA